MTLLLSPERNMARILVTRETSQAAMEALPPLLNSARCELPAPTAPNIASISVTFETSHAPISWLKKARCWLVLAEENMKAMSVTARTSQAPIGWLKSPLRNIARMVVTFETSHPPSGWL